MKKKTEHMIPSALEVIRSVAVGDTSCLTGFLKGLLLNIVKILAKVVLIPNTVEFSSTVMACFIIHMHTDARNLETLST
jgi:hypothetical protein